MKDLWPDGETRVEHLEAGALRLELIEIPRGQGNSRHGALPFPVFRGQEVSAVLAPELALLGRSGSTGVAKRRGHSVLASVL